MATKTSNSESSPELDDDPPTLLREKDERIWKSYFSHGDNVTTAILHQTPDDISQNSLGFLYDYYGMIEDPQQPPSPTSSLSNGNTDQDSGPGSNSKETEHEFIPTGGEVKVLKSNQYTTSGTGNQGSPVATVTSSTEPVKIQIAGLLKTESTCTPGERTTVTVVSSGRCAQPADITQISPERLLRSSGSGLVTDRGNLKGMGLYPTWSRDTSTGDELTFIVPHFPMLSKATNTVFQTEEKYQSILEAPTSIIQKRGEDTLTYLNKGQFYAVTLESAKQPQEEVKFQRVKIRRLNDPLEHHGKVRERKDEKDPRNELSHWKFWHAQQPNPNQRAFDVDRKSCQNIDDHIDEIAYNALGFTWNPANKAKIVIRINCLSTDFSPQKGVKGIPLNIQTDTYEDLEHSEAEPVHRASCQIKIFRDKGAERKNKDETKSAEKRMMKVMRQSTGSGAQVTSVFQVPNKVTRLLPTTTYGPKPVTFSLKQQTKEENSSPPPANSSFLFNQLRDREQKRGFSAALAVAKDDLEDLSVLPKYKNPRVTKKRTPAVTIYVRKEEEKVYNALLLENLTTEDLKRAVAAKYGMPSEMIKNLYKKTRKGLLVNLDDEMVELFVDEDDFIMTVDFDNQLGYFELIFQY